MYTFTELLSLIISSNVITFGGAYFIAPKMVAKSLARENEAQMQTNTEQAITTDDHAITIEEMNRQIVNLKEKSNALELKRNQQRNEIEKEVRQDLINPIRNPPFALTEEFNKFLCLSCLVIHKTPNVYCERVENMPSVIWCKKCKSRIVDVVT